MDGCEAVQLSLAHAAQAVSLSTGASKLLDFEFDPGKNEIVLGDQGFDFFQASRVFNAAVLERPDTRGGYGEPRWQVIGEADGRLYFVVYTVRAGACRLISARLAEEDEEDFWNEYR